MNSRSARGSIAYHSGIAAENTIALEYERRGYAVVKHRWRGRRGEIDLILRDGDGLIFVEVKKSRSFDTAAQSLSRRQMRRIQVSAEEYLVNEPNALMTDMRIDVALMNQAGETQIIENASFDF